MQIHSQQINTTIALLGQHIKLQLLSVSTTLIALLLLLGLASTNNLSRYWLIALLLITLLGLLQSFYAIRVGFDLKLLKQLREHPVDLDSAINDLDDSLKRLRLIPKNKPSRSIEERLLACVGLFKLQTLCCTLQLVTVPILVLLHLTLN